MTSAVPAQGEHQSEPAGDGLRKRRTALSWVRGGCLLLLLLFCGLAGLSVTALRNGPASIELPGGTLLAIGSDDFVISNYHFHEGETYFFDINGNGVRNIFQMQFLDDKGSIELTLNYADSDEQHEQQLMSLQLPW